jgi:hypothetical protein
MAILFGRHAPSREKSETHTEFLVGIMDEEDVFADVDI